MKDISTKKYGRCPAIYCITNLVTGYVYVGSTVNLYRRLIHHRAQLLLNRHSNLHLQRSFNNNGIDNFTIEVLEFCEKDSKELYHKEGLYCLQYDKLYNQHTIEEISFGHTWTLNDEVKKKMSNIKKGKIPKNLNYIQQKHRRKIIKIVDEKITETFDSCTDAAKSLNMKPNTFNLYIGKKLGRKKSKYFPKNTRYEYV
jgi:group I intron endonuclease